MSSPSVLLFFYTHLLGEKKIYFRSICIFSRDVYIWSRDERNIRSTLTWGWFCWYAFSYSHLPTSDLKKETLLSECKISSSLRIVIHIVFLPSKYLYHRQCPLLFAVSMNFFSSSFCLKKIESPDHGKMLDGVSVGLYVRKRVL